MFIDDAVIAGLIVVGSTIAFVGGIWYFIYQDARKRKNP